MELLLTIVIWTFWGLLGLLGLVIFLLNMPYQLKVVAAGEVEWAEARAWVVWPYHLLGLSAEVSFEQLRYQFYLLGIPVKSGPLIGSKKEKAEKKEEKREKKAKPKEKKSKSAAQIVYLARMPHVGHLLGRLPRWLFLRGVMQGRLGFSDPYTTGQVAAFIGLARCFFPDFAKEVELDFQETAFEGRVRVSITIWLPRIAAGLIGYALSRRGRAMIRHYMARPKPAATTT